MLPSPTNNKEINTTINEILKLLISNGTDAILPVFRSLMNEAMKIERNQMVGQIPTKEQKIAKGMLMDLRIKQSILEWEKLHSIS